jgi:uroporphyrinogen decarboxylase
LIVNKRERLDAALSGSQPDRPPVALWRHFPVDDQSPQTLAAAVVNFQHTYDFDLVKVTPASSFCIKDWGAEDYWEGNPEGTRRYTRHVIQHPQDWEMLPLLDPHRGQLAAQLECLRLIRQQLGPDVPVIQTIFSPLSQAKNLVGGEQLIIHLRRWPEALKTGLRTITASTIRFVEAVLETGIDGIFYAVQHAQYGLLTPAEYAGFGREDDLDILAPAGDAWLRLLHLHGREVMFDLLADYPVNILNWHDQETSPTLPEALSHFRGVVCGGLRQWDTMVLGTPELVEREARDAIQATQGRRFMLGTGCVVPITAPHGNLIAARRAVDV